MEGELVKYYNTYLNFLDFLEYKEFGGGGEWSEGDFMNNSSIS